MGNEKRKIITSELIPLMLTVIIAVSAAFSTYFSYQTVKMASGQEARERREEMIDWATLFTSVLEPYLNANNEGNQDSAIGSGNDSNP